ncbi:MAG: hypothetical protein II695_03845 [Oscillospiraceae bacterium]|nr:hypothetical protein [Oscillospiraceae bacterium]
MKTVTICGSMRFERDMQKIAFILETRYDMSVLQCVYTGGRRPSDADISALERAHFQKIAISDAVYVVDIGGYIGDQASKEIDYAKSMGKEIIYHSRFGL